VAITVGVITGGLVAVALGGLQSAGAAAAIALEAGGGAAAAAGAAAGASASTAVVTIAAGAAAGAASGATGAVLNGGDLGDALRGAALGGLIGGVTAGVLPGGGAARGGLEVAAAYQQGGLAQATGTVLQEAASHAGNMVFQGVAQDAAERNGVSLTQLNVALTAASVAGNVLVGSRLGQLGATEQAANGNNVAGILSRDHDNSLLSSHIGPRLVNRVLGVPFDAIDLALNYQGLPSASGYQALVDGTVSTLRVGHSAGASELAALGNLGVAPSGATLASLPFGRVAPSGLNVVNGKWDLVNGGWLGRLLNPGAIVLNTGKTPIANHRWREYEAIWPPPKP
jgi:hypothetical protein